MMRYINRLRTLKSPPIDIKLMIDGIKQHGYSDEEIADFMGTKHTTIAGIRKDQTPRTVYQEAFNLLDMYMRVVQKSPPFFGAET